MRPDKMDCSSETKRWLTAPSDAACSWTSSQGDQQMTYKTLSWVGYGVGSACLATGAILFVVGVGQRSGSTGVAFAQPWGLASRAPC